MREKRKRWERGGWDGGLKWQLREDWRNFERSTSKVILLGRIEPQIETWPDHCTHRLMYYFMYLLSFRFQFADIKDSVVIVHSRRVSWYWRVCIWFPFLAPDTQFVWLLYLKWSFPAYVQAYWYTRWLCHLSLMRAFNAFLGSVTNLWLLASLFISLYPGLLKRIQFESIIVSLVFLLFCGCLFLW